ncbi:hypothetical protein Clacol_001922 [Clathrus columnatus]|uniref:Nucleotide exchange factor Fes1 domain-containing protein n=1 Tax=Clathrus columnatus TaxID=1419009 RepID=A0AAV5A284_9AGAM|nr:hypothetical protein Clacol_001922 [Clathrus columnatus]
MESLLRWSIENSSTSNDPNGSVPPPRSAKELDPGIIDMILGKPDAVLMKEALAAGLDESKSIESRMIALDDLEMLVEQIDNAKNLKPLKMYPSLLSLLSPSQPDEVRMQTLWILGTAVQNNPEAQADFLSHEPLPLILSILSHNSSESELSQVSSETRSKAAYTLSGILKHNAFAVSKLEDIGGWDVLRSSLQDPDITIRRKIAFLLTSLLRPDEFLDSSNLPTTPPPPSAAGLTIRVVDSSPNAVTAVNPVEEFTHGVPSYDIKSLPTSTSAATVTALRKHQIIPTLIQSLASPVPFGPNADQYFDEDYAEKAARAIATYLEAGGTLTEDDNEKSDLKKFINDARNKSSIELESEAWEILENNVFLTV